MPENLRETLDFLQDLRANNNKPWFEQNRKRFDAARDAYEAFITDLILSFGEFEDLGGVTAKECIYRIYRDVRFSPDKTPYKAYMGAVIGKGGRKSADRAYYIQISSSNESFIAAGLYAPTSEQLEKMRHSIANDSRTFKEVIDAPDFKHYFGKLEGNALKTTPQGFRKDHSDIELLRFKQYLAAHPLSEEQIVSSELTSYVIEVFRALKPFVTYISDVLDT